MPTVDFQVTAPRIGYMTEAASVAAAVASEALASKCAEFLQDLVGVGQHVHQVRDGRTLVAGHIAHAGLQQGLGDREDALAAELFARADAQLLDFFLKDLSAISNP